MWLALCRAVVVEQGGLPVAWWGMRCGVARVKGTVVRGLARVKEEKARDPFCLATGPVRRHCQKVGIVGFTTSRHGVYVIGVERSGHLWGWKWGEVAARAVAGDREDGTAVWPRNSLALAGVKGPLKPTATNPCCHGGAAVGMGQQGECRCCGWKPWGREIRE